jgi:hypothetical protein
LIDLVQYAKNNNLQLSKYSFGFKSIKDGYCNSNKHCAASLLCHSYLGNNVNDNGELVWELTQVMRGEIKVSSWEPSELWALSAGFENMHYNGIHKNLYQLGKNLGEIK